LLENFAEQTSDPVADATRRGSFSPGENE